MLNPKWASEAEALRQRRMATGDEFNQWLRDFIKFVDHPVMPANWQMTERPFGEGVDKRVVDKWAVEMHSRIVRIRDDPHVDHELLLRAVTILLHEVFKIPTS